MKRAAGVWAPTSTDAVVGAIELIRTHPEIGTLRGRLPHRRVVVGGFPYQIVYRVRDTDLYVIAANARINIRDLLPRVTVPL